MKRNTLIAQITLGTFICLAAAQMSRAMQEPQITLESADGRQFVLPQSVAFVSDYVRALKTGGFLEATQEGPLKLPDIPAEELSILVQIMNLLHANQALPNKIQAAAIAQMPLITVQNIDALINDVQFLQLPESCITGLINRLAEFVNQQVVAGEDIEIPFDDRDLLTQLGRTYFLKYDQDLDLTDAEGSPIDIGGFSIRELLDAGRAFPIIQSVGRITYNLYGMRINSLDGLLDIPEVKQCTALNLSNNRLNTIQSDVLQQLPALENLDLVGNQISSIRPDTFQGLSNLRLLSLGENQITSIEPGTFQGLRQLRYLALNGNKLTSIRPDSFRELSDLRFLGLDNNRISTIQPGAFRGLSNLGALYLHNNQISIIHPLTFRELSSLGFLRLGNNQINSIQPDTFQGLLNLGELDLSKNQIHSVTSRTLHGLLELKELNLASNEISSVEPGTFAGPPLKTLDLSDNRLSSDTIQELREGLLPGCELLAQNQREETPEERREKLAEATEKRIPQQ